jgi:hypothetical protein
MGCLGGEFYTANKPWQLGKVKACLIAKAVLLLRSGRSLPLHKEYTALANRQAFALPNCQGLFAVYALQ